MKGSKLGIRLLYYFGGFFVMTIGIALSVKSNLGVSPVSSIPYTMTCVWGIEMGVATVIFHVILVILQMLLMRRRFECKNLLQIPVGMVFGAFTTTCNTLAAMLPSTDNLIIRLLMCWIATVFVAIGIFFYVPADIMPLAGEGAMLAISTLTGKPFPTVKIAFDVSMVIISLITCLIFLHGLGSVGIGTVIAALLVGIELRMITHRFGRWRDKLLAKQFEIRGNTAQILANRTCSIMRCYLKIPLFLAKERDLFMFCAFSAAGCHRRRTAAAGTRRAGGRPRQASISR